MKIVTIVGARPQFVKAAVVSRALRTWNEKHPGYPLNEVIVHTGQHYDSNMSDVFFEEMGIPRPAHHLGVAGLSHGAMTGRMLEGIESILLAERPDAVLTYGDTNSTLAGALAASKLHIPIAHVEAGLRSFNMRMPEEVNRILSDRVSKWLFCPTSTAVTNLAKENLVPAGEERVVANVGDVMFDAHRFYRKSAKKPSFVPAESSRPFVLLTLHRQENTDDPGRMRSLFKALHTLAADVDVIFPVHPRTRSVLATQGIESSSSLRFVDPVPYFEMLWLLEHCKAVLTDSGGVQKEACFALKRCVTLRDETEWVETVEAGVNVLVGADGDALLKEARRALGTPFGLERSLYGEGRAGEDIVAMLAKGG
ncbi:MAG: UDP-N-acetylglucosamine 2-epimerase (non-hydrolyzing) [Silvanigrellales bacterium]|jgi:UDP-GlcNAc3NAcA epimerase|nr:UDP-N-acetylglucosamine 2-epimerase (non-hydrolyzing) [Silvanigrellales bacterium]